MWQRLRELDGAMLFVAVTLALTLGSALLCVPAADAVEPSARAMLRASVIYVAVVGWQPLVGFVLARRYFIDERPIDDGIRPVALRDSLFEGNDARWLRALHAQGEPLPGVAEAASQRWMGTR